MLKQYASIEYYRDTYGGSFVGADNVLNRALKLATIKVDALTFNRIVDIDKLTAFQQDLVRTAVCLQADYQLDNGNADNSSGDISSYSSLDISVSMNSNKSQFKQALSEHGISTEAYDILQQTGLMWRGI